MSRIPAMHGVRPFSCMEWSCPYGKTRSCEGWWKEGDGCHAGIGHESLKSRIDVSSLVTRVAGELRSLRERDW